MNARNAIAQGLTIITEAEVAKPRPYYTVAELQTGTGCWLPLFGDYDKDVARDELSEWKDANPGGRYKLVRTATDDQPAINAALVALTVRAAAQEAAQW